MIINASYALNMVISGRLIKHSAVKHIAVTYFHEKNDRAQSLNK